MLSLLLVLAMVVTVLPVAALAAGDEVAKDADGVYRYANHATVALGVNDIIRTVHVTVPAGSADVYVVRIFPNRYEDTRYHNGDEMDMSDPECIYGVYVDSVAEGYRLTGLKFDTIDMVEHLAKEPDGKWGIYINDILLLGDDDQVDIEVNLEPIPEVPETLDTLQVVFRNGYQPPVLDPDEFYFPADRDEYFDFSVSGKFTDGTGCLNSWITGTWEYSLNGTTWMPILENGFNNFLPLGDCLSIYDFANGQFYLRFRLDSGNGWFNLGSIPMYSKVVHGNPDKPFLEPGQSGNPGFTDVPAGAYYEKAVNWAVASGITSGTTPTTFSPNESCTRAQAVSFLWRAAGKPMPTGVSNPFTDVADSAYYANAVLWAVEAGVTSGTTPTTFDPNAECTRAQIVRFLWAAAGRPGTSIANPFTDVVPGKYYEQAVLWAVEDGVTRGLTDTTFGPDINCTRGQIACFLYNFAH